MDLEGDLCRMSTGDTVFYSEMNKSLKLCVEFDFFSIFSFYLNFP